MFCPLCLHKLRQDVICSYNLSCLLTKQRFHPFPLTPPPPPAHFPFLCYESRQSDCLHLWPLLTFQALDAIEKAQDLAEEVGNKVRHGYVSWVWDQEPKEEN